LQAHGVEPIESLGESFDPSIHQAMLQKYEEDKEDGVVLEEFQRGYKLGDRVIRPAKVVVNKYPEDEFEAQESEGETDGEQLEDEQ
jgi:molecular chaperone GrpE